MLPSFPRFLPSVLAAVTLSLVTALPVSAQQRPRTSPHETISLVVDTSRVMIVYGRP